MTERDRFKAAEEAALKWTPDLSRQYAGAVRFARQCFAEGYAAALSEIAEQSPLENCVDKPIEREWRVAPC
jgi:hypothetical protein